MDPLLISDTAVAGQQILEALLFVAVNRVVEHRRGEDKVFKTSQLLRSLAEMMRIHMK